MNNARRALAIALGGMIEDGVVSRSGAVEIARMVLRDNAVGLYKGLYKLSPSRARPRVPRAQPSLPVAGAWASATRCRRPARARRPALLRPSSCNPPPALAI